jgi:hypothetical protein
MFETAKNISTGSNGYLILTVLFLSVVVLSFAINHLLANSIGRGYRLFVAPGVVLHELSHAFTCLLTGAHVTHISMFKKEGGEVTHGYPKIPIIGQIIISLSPFIVGSIAIYFLARALGIGGAIISTSSFDPRSIINLGGETLSLLNLREFRTWLILYLSLSIAVTMTPSLKDIRNILFSLAVLLLAIFAIYKYTPIRVSLAFLLQPSLFVVLYTIVILLILGLILSIIVSVVASIFKTS